MSKKFMWLVASGTLALVLAGCSGDKKADTPEVSEKAQKTFLFFNQQTTNEDGQNIGDLYIHTMDEEGKEEKIASDVLDGRFFYNMEKDYVLYLSDEDELFKVAAGEAKEKLAKDVIYFDGSSNDNIVVYTDKDENLFTIDLDKETVDGEKIASEVGNYELNEKSIYYVNKDADLKLYNTESREEKTIAEEVNNFEFNGSELLYTDEDDMLFYKANTDEESLKVTGDTVYLSDVTKDKNDIYFISRDDDDSVLNTVSVKELGTTKKLANSVMDYKVVNGEVVYLTDDNNLFTKEKESDTAKKLASDISSYLFSNGELYLRDLDNSLFSTTEDGTKKIASKVVESHITDGGDVIYVNENDELFVNDKKIESDVQSVSNLEDSVAFATDENKLYFLSSVKEEAKVISDELDNYSTVSYLNKEIYRNALSFKDVAGYWKYEDDLYYLLIKEDGVVEDLLGDDRPAEFEVIEDTASLTNFSFQEKGTKEGEIGSIELDGKTLKLSEASEDDTVSLEKVTKEEAEEAVATVKKARVEEAQREKEHEDALAEEEITSNIDSKLHDYFSFFDQAMYSGNTEDMSELVSPSSSFYTSQKAYIERCYDKGTYVTENSTDIVNHTKISDGKYEVTVDEDYTVYKKDGSTKESVYTNVYIVEEFEDGWYITGLKQ